MTNGLMRPMDNSPESIVKRLRELKQRSGLTMREIAKAMGYRDASSIQRYFNHEQLKIRFLPRDLVAKFEQAFLGKGIPPIQKSEIWELAGPEFRFVPHPPNAVVSNAVATGGRPLPVYGSAVAGIDGEFEMNGNVLFEVMAPPSLSLDVNAYAVQVSGESMENRYYDGEVVYVDPSRRVKRGDFVVVQIAVDENRPPLAYIKRFVRHNVEELVLEQFNPPKELRFPSDQVQSVHFIAGTAPA